MTRTELAALHVQAQEAVRLAHAAYTMALQNRQADGDTRAAYDTLLQANRLSDKIYAALLGQTV